MPLDPFASLAAKYAAPDYQRDFAGWARDRLNIHLYSVQIDCGQELTRDDVDEVLVRSCHSSGKTYLAAALACWWLDIHPPGQARVISTAPSGAQVRGLLWNEINQMWERATALGNPLPGRVNQTEWWIGTFQAGIGRKPSDYREQMFSGFHARYVLEILDEADALLPKLWNDMDKLTTNRGAKRFAIGNPYNPNSVFAKAQSSPGTRTIVKRIAAWDTPNFSGEPVPDPLPDVLLAPQWVEERRLKWGGRAAQLDPAFTPDHPFWSSQVEAEYPDDDELAIIRIGDILACWERDEEDANIVPLPRESVALGIDLAGSEGGDETVIRERRGNRALRRWGIRTDDPAELEDFVLDRIDETGAATVVLDITGGWGFGLLGSIRKRRPLVQALGFNFGAGARDKKQFINARAEIYWMARDLSINRTWDLSQMEEAQETIAQLVAVRRKVEGKLLQVESKAELIKRLGQSPDDADALLLAYWSYANMATTNVGNPGGVTLPTGSAAATARNISGARSASSAGIVLPTRVGARR